MEDGASVADGAGGQAVVADHGLLRALTHDVGARRAVGLVLGRAALEPVVQRWLATVEVGQLVMIGQRLRRREHWHRHFTRLA
jgi:hypothetical protein